MKQYNLRIPNTLALACCLLASVLAALSCRKEKAPEPSGQDKNYFVINDNPNDPIDHSIYEFYKATGIASFYSDTIYKKRISSEDEIPARYSYIKLSLEYSPLGEAYVYFDPLTSKRNIPSFLTLLQEEVVPKFPSSLIIPSILLIDSLGLPYPSVNIQIAHGWTAQHGFNTVGIAVKNVDAMNSNTKKMYAASILAGIALKKINDLYGRQLQSDFYSVSREAAKNLIPIDLYSGFPYLFLLPPDMVPQPEEIGLLFHATFLLGDMPFDSTPRESDDIRAFLTAVFYYTNQAFSDLHINDTLVLKKFSIIRNLAQEAGFKLPD